jgi:hypothetical protein
MKWPMNAGHTALAIGVEAIGSIAGTGIVPYGRTEETYGQMHHVPLRERRKRDGRSQEDWANCG